MRALGSIGSSRGVLRMSYGLGRSEPFIRNAIESDDKWHRVQGQQWICSYGWNIKRRRHLGRDASCYDVYRHKEWLASFFTLESAFDWCEERP